MQCSVCHMLLPKDAIVCPRCASDVAGPAPISAKRPSTLAARPGAPTTRPGAPALRSITPTVVLRLDDATTFVLTGKFEFILGRRDATDVQHPPDVDLTPWNKKGTVSRRQAKIILTREGVFIEDLGGANKTIRNNFRLYPGQRYPIEDGDILLLGDLAIWVAIRPDSGSIKA